MESDQVEKRRKSMDIMWLVGPSSSPCLYGVISLLLFC